MKNFISKPLDVLHAVSWTEVFTVDSVHSCSCVIPLHFEVHMRTEYACNHNMYHYVGLGLVSEVYLEGPGDTWEISWNIISLYVCVDVKTETSVSVI
jgi:hypothetical protein